MYYRCTGCNAANESKKGYPKKCKRCGNKKLVRAERIRILVTGEFYRSAPGNITWCLNEDRTEFWTR
jgi:DNA-directed RNA polymerase subunit RPC12/RpoP